MSAETGRPITGLPVATTVAGADSTVSVVGGVTSEITYSNLVDSSPFTSNFAGFLKSGHPVASGGTRVGLPGVAWAGTTTTVTLVALQIYYMPFLVDTAVTVDATVVEVTAVGGGTILRTGIMGCSDTTWQPTSVRQDAGTVATSVAVLTTSFTGISLVPGRYLMALVGDGTPSVRVLRGGVPFGEVIPTLGANPLVRHHTLAAAGTGALSAANDWDTLTANTVSQDYSVFLRLTGL